jgi:hypothetical protein
MSTLEMEEPRAYRRLLKKLERHRLTGGEIFTDRGGALPFPQGAATSLRPTDDVLRRAAAFCDDSEPTSIVGVKHDSPPRRFMLLTYYGALAHHQSRDERAASERATEDVAKRFGRTVESCRKSLKQAMRETAPAEKAFLKRSGPTLWRFVSGVTGGT